MDSSRSPASRFRISGVEKTSDTLTSRGGLSFFITYLRAMGIYPLLEPCFGALRKSAKGQPVAEVFKQVFACTARQISRRLERFGSSHNRGAKQG